MPVRIEAQRRGRWAAGEVTVRRLPLSCGAGAQCGGGGSMPCPTLCLLCYLPCELRACTEAPKAGSVCNVFLSLSSLLGGDGRGGCLRV